MVPTPAQELDQTPSADRFEMLQTSHRSRPASPVSRSPAAGANPPKRWRGNTRPTLALRMIWDIEEEEGPLCAGIVLRLPPRQRCSRQAQLAIMPKPRAELRHLSDLPTVMARLPVPHLVMARRHTPIARHPATARHLVTVQCRAPRSHRRMAVVHHLATVQCHAPMSRHPMPMVRHSATVHHLATVRALWTIRHRITAHRRSIVNLHRIQFRAALACTVCDLTGPRRRSSSDLFPVNARLYAAGVFRSLSWLE
jgi:hypothetical protein